MTPFTESLRYQYEFAEGDIVIDAGAFEGNFTKILLDTHPSVHVMCFEPVFTEQVTDKLLAAHPDKSHHVFGSALGNSKRIAMFHIKGDMTGLHSDGCAAVEVHVYDVAKLFTEYGIDEIALLKLNIEGMEYEVIERLAEMNLLPRIKNLQIQWHAVVPAYAQRRDAIWEVLRRTHDQQWEPAGFDNDWDGWKRKNA